MSNKKEEMSVNEERPKKAAVHSRVRRQHSDELAQDYVEAVEHLLRTGGEARVKDLQRIFGVSHVSVIRAMKRLEERDLVIRAKKGGFLLTPEGTQMAKEARARHELVVEFLQKLGVSAKRAEEDAEGLEHHLSPETLEAMRGFVGDEAARVQC